MLTKRYLPSVGNLASVMSKIVEGAAPEKFTQAHLKGIGFTSSNDRAFIPLLKSIGFLSSDGAPTERYHAYRDGSRSMKVMGEALLEAYQDVFTINENPTSADQVAIRGKFKSTHNGSDNVAELQARTFLALLELADLDAARGGVPQPARTEEEQRQAPVEEQPPAAPVVGTGPGPLRLRYNIEVHLPPTKDVEVYNAIFKALREHLLVD